MRRVAPCIALLAALVLAAPAAASAALPKDFYGAVSQAPLFNGDGPHGFNDFEKMKQGGVGSLRFILPWTRVEREQGNYRWSAIDETVGETASRGIDVLPFIFGSPPWIAPNAARPPIDTAAHKQAWKSFLRKVVQRYGPGGEYWSGEYRDDFPGKPARPIRTYQIWNEPSSGTRWKPEPDAKEYAELFDLAREAIRSEDPEAKFALAGLFTTPREGRGGIPAWKFIKRLYQAPGFKSKYDYFALHPYAANLKQVKKQIKLVRKALRKAGDGKRQIWITELGWASSGPKGPVTKSPKEQAKLLKQSFRLLTRKRNAWHIRGIHWFAWQDAEASTPSDICSFCKGAGLFKQNRKAKPSYAAYRDATGG